MLPPLLLIGQAPKFPLHDSGKINNFHCTAKKNLILKTKNVMRWRETSIGSERWTLVSHLFFGINGLLSCRYLHLLLLTSTYVRVLTVSNVSLPFFIVSFQLCPFKLLGLSLPLPNNTDGNVSEAPGASSGSWSPLKTPVPTAPSPGSNFLGMKLQGPQLSSLFSSSECECVSDRMVMSIPQMKPQSFPLSQKTDLFSRAKQIL